MSIGIRDGDGAGGRDDVHHHVGPDVVGRGTSCDNVNNVLGLSAVIVAGADTTVATTTRLGSTDGVTVEIAGETFDDWSGSLDINSCDNVSQDWMAFSAEAGGRDVHEGHLAVVDSSVT